MIYVRPNVPAAEEAKVTKWTVPGGTRLAVASGLALAFLASAPHAHGNDVIIWNRSEEGGGTRFAIMAECDENRVHLEAGEDVGCTDPARVSLTPAGPLADRIRMRVVSGKFYKALDGPYKRGTVTFDTNRTNPDCGQKNFVLTEMVNVGYLETFDEPLQFVEDDIVYVTVKHICQLSRAGG